MNKALSPNSGTSSETSETHSVEENSQGTPPTTPVTTNSNTRPVSKGWRRMKELTAAAKDSEEKRPPWRAVSASTLPKPDKNALLRAKLLDASRRLRGGKTSIGLQTDVVPTILMKEVSLDVQRDLFAFKDVGILTDGSYTKKKEDIEEFVMTYSISQMTDPIAVLNESTQTLLPKVAGDDFMEAYLNCNRGNVTENKETFTDLERKLLEQIFKIRRTGKLSTMRDDGTQSYGVDNYSSGTELLQMSADTTYYSVEKLEENIPNAPYRSGMSLLKSGTLDSWQFKYDHLNMDKNDKFIPYTIYPYRPWNSFIPITFSSREDWNFLSLAIDQLLQESNRLIDIIEDIATNRNNQYVSKCELKSYDSLPSLSQDQIDYPSDHWLPIITQQEEQLDNLLKKSS